jgi:V-ATPase subunit C
MIADFVLYQMREFEYSPEVQDTRKQELQKLMQDQDAMRSSLLQWCYSSYGEVLIFLPSRLYIPSHTFFL